VPLALKALQARMVLLVPLALKALQARMVLLVPLALKALQAPMVLLVPLALTTQPVGCRLQCCARMVPLVALGVSLHPAT
jgi:hypothetical protein